MARVFVGLSGGVDSAVSAALLKERGYDVVGVFIKIWQPEFIECTWREDRLDAMRVAAALEIPFREVDFSEEYKTEVVERMVRDYERGMTPNPDVFCNSSIKFGHFLRFALGEGADMIATGHYARIARSEKFGLRKPEYADLRNPYMLLRGRDTNKDQSYFLWQLGQQELAKSMFPVGDLTKAEVRAYARRIALPNAEKPDSQGLCFIGEVSIADFLSRYITLKAGDVLDTKGNRIGNHQGAALYTTGQRHGFSVTSATDTGSHYIVAIDIARNTLTASPDKRDAFVTSARLGECNWIERVPQDQFEAEIQTRYREVPFRAHITREKDGATVTFAKPHLASSGQSLVVYDADKVLGGGVIRAG